MAETATRPEFLTVKELAELLRVKERKVYDLAASGEVPCSRATGKLLFPEAEIRAWIEDKRTGSSPRTARPAIFLGSHDPLLEWALRQSRSGLPMFFDGSLDGLRRFAAGEGIAAGLHVHEPAGGWNVARVAEACSGLDAVLIAWATRRRGLVVRSDGAAKIGSVADLRGKRVAARQSESGADLLMGELLNGAGLARGEVRFTEAARSEDDAVLSVAQGAADAALGLESLAAQYGLSFVPVVEERFDIVVDRRAYFEPPIQALLAFAGTDAFRARAAAMGGYDIAGLGEVRWNA